MYTSIYGANIYIYNIILFFIFNTFFSLFIFSYSIGNTNKIQYNFVCWITGARKHTNIHTNKQTNKYNHTTNAITQDETLNNLTRSELSFVPSTEDDGKSITCRAENPIVTGLFLETSWKLNVVCK